MCKYLLVSEINWNRTQLFLPNTSPIFFPFITASAIAVACALCASPLSLCHRLVSSGSGSSSVGSPPALAYTKPFVLPRCTTPSDDALKRPIEPDIVPGVRPTPESAFGVVVDMPEDLNSTPRGGGGRADADKGETAHDVVGGARYGRSVVGLVGLTSEGRGGLGVHTTAEGE